MTDWSNPATIGWALNIGVLVMLAVGWLLTRLLPRNPEQQWPDKANEYQEMQKEFTSQ